MFGFLKALGKKTQTIFSSSNMSYFDAFGQPISPTASQLINEYRNIVYSCATINAQAVSSVPLRLYVQTAKNQIAPKCKTSTVSETTNRYLQKSYGIPYDADIQEVLEHPLLDLIYNPNPYFGLSSLLEITDLYQELVGSCYWRLVKNALGVPSEIWILQSQLIEVVFDKITGLPSAITYGTLPNKQTIPREELVDFHFPNLENPYGKGWSPARAAYETISLMNKHQAYNNAMVTNRSRPDVILSPKEAISEPVAARLLKKFQMKFSGARSGGVAVLEEPLQVTPITIPPKDLEMMSMYNISKIEIGNAYGIPMSLLETKDVNRANAEAGHYQHAKLSVRPRIIRRDSTLNRLLCPLFDKRLFFASDNCVPEDYTLQSDIATKRLVAGMTTINEERVEIGKKPVEWGTEPWISTALNQPSKMAASDLTGQEATVPSEEAANQNRTTANSEDETETTVAQNSMVDTYLKIIDAYACGKLSKRAAMNSLVKFAELTLEEATHLLMDMDNEKDPSKKKVRRTTGRSNVVIPNGDELKPILRRMFDRQKEKFQHQFGLKSVDQDGLPKDVGDLSSKQEDAKELEPVLSMYYSSRGKSVLIRLGKKDEAEKWNVSLPQVRDAIQKSAIKISEDSAGVTGEELEKKISRLRNDLAEGILERSNTGTELAKIVSEVFDNAKGYRANRIAQTEASRAVHDAEILAGEQSGVVTGYQFLASADACPICMEIAEKNAEISMADAKAQIGSYDREIPPIHPNCMCSMTEVLVYKEEEEKPVEPTDETPREVVPIVDPHTEEPIEKPPTDEEIRNPHWKYETAEEYRQATLRMEEFYKLHQQDLYRLEKEREGIDNKISEISIQLHNGSAGLSKKEKEELERRLKYFRDRYIENQEITNKQKADASMFFFDKFKAKNSIAFEFDTTNPNAVIPRLSDGRQKAEQLNRLQKFIEKGSTTKEMFTIKINELKEKGIGGSYNDEVKSISLKSNSPFKIAAHEFGHAVADWKDAEDKCATWIMNRASGEKVKQMEGFKRGVKGVKDKLSEQDIYAGRIYKDGATEILSVGLQNLADNPVEFAKRDPDFFRFTMSHFKGVKYE